MKLVMCRACGEFTRAIQEDGEIVPLQDECPSCGGMEFKHNATETFIRTDE